MSKTRLKLGKQGELYAAKFLQDTGWHLIAKNYFTRYGELDLVMMEHQQLVFIEVKTRKNQFFGDVRESLSRSKLHKIFLSAQIYLQKNKLENHCWRIDFLGLEKKLDTWKLVHIRNLEL